MKRGRDRGKREGQRERGREGRREGKKGGWRRRGKEEPVEKEGQLSGCTVHMSKCLHGMCTSGCLL